MAGMETDAAIAQYASHVDWKNQPRLKDADVFKRFHADEPGCLVCNRSGAHAHHLLSRAQGGDDVEANLIPLCSLHHMALHSSTPDKVFVTSAIGGYLESAGGSDALSYLRSKRSDEWISGKFGVDLD